MNLIDKDALKQHIKDYGKGAINSGLKTLDPVDDILAISNIVEFMPTVDAVPVVHGKWEKKEVFEVAGTIEEMQSAKCTNCGNFHTTPYLYWFHDYKFCPCCGARMDGE